MKYTRLFVLFALMGLALGCQKIEDFQGAEVVSGPAEFAIPLVKATTTMQDLLENFDEYTFIEITPDGVIHLRYKGDVLTQEASEFFKDARDSIPPIIPLDDTLYALPFSSPQQLEVDYAVYKSGHVKFVCQSDYVGTIDFTLSILQASKNGVVAQVHQQFTSPPSLPGGFFASTAFVDVAGYDLIPQNDTIYIRYEAITDAGDRIKLPKVFLINENVDFSYIEGYLGNFKHNGKEDTIKIEFFKNWIQGDVYFEQPNIYIHVENSFGVPTRSDIKLFDVLTANNTRLPLQSDFITGEGIDFVYPPLNEVGAVKTMTFAFNESNSNIEEVLGSRPIAIDYDVDALMNPDTLTSLRGFITDSSYYKIQVEVDLPLHGRASGFGVVDTFDVNFDGYGSVSEAEFKMVADNGMPLEIDAQVYFLDENGTVLDSLFENGRTEIVGSADAGTDGIVTNPTTKTTFAKLPGTRFDQVRSAKKMTLHAFFSTFHHGQQSVKAFADQKVEIRMGMKLKTK
ncbi:MAG: hypothetical protein EPO28_11595 [Saprospiraceae bacterium]|nr:MAG: hypothetical protein EPO28_11595 [Saprospiraceae bacterium]